VLCLSSTVTESIENHTLVLLVAMIVDANFLPFAGRREICPTHVVICPRATAIGRPAVITF